VDVPKVSEEHKNRRREQIIDGARRCFARHGYEGATVARLEDEIGLSRGAIFNYFPNKEALFVAVAASLSDRMMTIWLEQGFRALLEAIVHEDTDWLAVQLEAVRRFRTDPEFQRQVAAQDEIWEETRDERLDALRAQGLRDDVGIDQVGIFLGLIANGLALRVTVGDPNPDLDVIAELVETGVGPRRGGRATRERKSAPQTRPTPRARRRSSAR
jgi:TetR/AcrR family transcriptional regulator, transcriptional repressor of aconitase